MAGGSGFGGYSQGFGNLIGQLPQNMQNYVGGGRYPGMQQGAYAQPGFMQNYGQGGRYNTLAQDLAQGRLGQAQFRPQPFGMPRYGFMPHGGQPMYQPQPFGGFGGFGYSPFSYRGFGNPYAMGMPWQAAPPQMRYQPPPAPAAPPPQQPFGQPGRWTDDQYRNWQRGFLDWQESG